MATNWGLLSRIGRKKIGDLKDSYQKGSRERIDMNLPLGLRINALVDIPEVDFILGGEELKAKYPGRDCGVASFGSFPIGQSQVYRFYLDTTRGPYMLQIGQDAKGVVEDCKLFMPYDEVYPQRDEDWDFWLNSDDGYIGYNVFQTKEGIAYFRAWENQDAEVALGEDEHGNRFTRIPPYQFMEAINKDPYGDDREVVKYDSMLYGRHVNDSVNEFLLVSAVTENEGASIQIMVGIELAPATINVI